MKRKMKLLEVDRWSQCNKCAFNERKLESGPDGCPHWKNGTLKCVCDRDGEPRKSYHMYVKSEDHSRLKRERERELRRRTAQYIVDRIKNDVDCLKTVFDALLVCQVTRVIVSDDLYEIGNAFGRIDALVNSYRDLVVECFMKKANHDGKKESQVEIGRQRHL